MQVGSYDVERPLKNFPMQRTMPVSPLASGLNKASLNGKIFSNKIVVQDDLTSSNQRPSTIKTGRRVL